MAESDGEKPKLEIPSGVAVTMYTREYVEGRTRRWGGRSFREGGRWVDLRFNYENTPEHAITEVQKSIDWVAANMGENPHCASFQGFRMVPDDITSTYVSYEVRPAAAG